METKEKIKKLQMLPWQAIHDIAIDKHIDARDVNGRDKIAIIETLLSYDALTDEEIEQLINDYIYGDRVTFTLWTFQSALTADDFGIIDGLENIEALFDVQDGFRNLKFLSVKNYEERVEILYVYSKEYTFIDEEGYNAGIWEQHRGCIWIGKDATYLACISKHDKMTQFIVKYISEKVANKLTQIKPPKSAIEKCAEFKAMSRIVLQGKGGEKTVVSRVGGITDEQEEEIKRIQRERIDTSGSYIAEITEDTDATVKYNVRKGSIGIYKHLSAPVLFDWSENAIKIIMQEIEDLRGKPAEEIFREVGQEIKWTGTSKVEDVQLNWYLTQVIEALDKENHQLSIPEDKMEILEKEKFFIKSSRIYCAQCEDYEVPHCANCGKKLRLHKNVIQRCDCGAPFETKCSEGHKSCEIVNWYIPTALLINMINKNIKKVFTDYELEYNMCILGDILDISAKGDFENEVEVAFGSIECFKHDLEEIPERLKVYAVNLNEKCKNVACSYEKIEKCLITNDMVCLPKVFYNILPGYRPQPHKGKEYGDVSSQVKVGRRTYEFIGIIKKNSRNSSNSTAKDSEKILTPLLATSRVGEEIIRQFVEQGMADARCQLIAVIAPQYFDASLKGTLRYLARLSGNKVTFIELDQVCSLIDMNETICV